MCALMYHMHVLKLIKEDKLSAYAYLSLGTSFLYHSHTFMLKLSQTSA
jgi:hypothetical protein